MIQLKLDDSEIIDIFYSGNKKPIGKELAKKWNN